MNLVRESLYNFHKTGDIRASLGLGGLSFETLYPGAILKCIKDFGVTEFKSGEFSYIKKDSGGNLTTALSAKDGFRFFKDNEYLLTNIEPADKNRYKLVAVTNFKDTDNLRNARLTFIKNKYLKNFDRLRTIDIYREWYTRILIFFMTKKEFENRFIIIEPGEK